MRADERDLRKYFKKVLECKVNEVIVLRDKRTNRHKGCAYVELGRLEDIPKALEASNKPPDFQRFPILIKASEAEKNYVLTNSQLTLTAKQMGAKGPVGPVMRDGKLLEAQKVYLGNLDTTRFHKNCYTQSFPNLDTWKRWRFKWILFSAHPVALPFSHTVIPKMQIWRFKL